MNNTKDKLSFFISYSHDDKRIKEVLLTNLKSLKATYNIEVWHDGKITAGSNINSAILKELSCSDVVLLLVTPSFIASYYCMNVELKEAIERMDKGECLVIPVICKPCALTEGLPFFQLNRVPKDGKPIAKYRSQVEGCTDATNMIKNMLESTFPNSKIRKTRGRKKQVAQLSPLTIDLYKEGKLQQIPVEQKFLDIIPEYINSIIDFNCMMPQALENSYKRFKKRYTELADKSTDNVLKLEKKELRLFLMDICGYVKKYITDSVGIRVHFRGTVNGKYVGIIASTDHEDEDDLDTDWLVDLTQIPIHQGLITHSFQLKAPLLKTLNQKLNYKGVNDKIWKEYMTHAFTQLSRGKLPILSMGISVHKDYYELKKDLFLLLAYSKIGNNVEKYIISYCSKCKTIDKNYDIEKVIKQKV